MKTLMAILAILAAILAIMGVIASDPWAVDLILGNLVPICVGLIVVASVAWLAFASGVAYERERRQRLLAPAFNNNGLADELRGPKPLKPWERFAVYFGATLFILMLIGPMALEFIQ